MKTVNLYSSIAPVLVLVGAMTNTVNSTDTKTIKVKQDTEIQKIVCRNNIYNNLGQIINTSNCRKIDFEKNVIELKPKITTPVPTKPIIKEKTKIAVIPPKIEEIKKSSGKCKNAKNGDIKSITKAINCMFGKKNGKIALAIALAENRTLSCNIISPTADVGIFQVNQVHWSKYGDGDRVKGLERLKNCNTNIKAGFEIFKNRGNFSAWTTYNNGAYLKFL